LDETNGSADIQLHSVLLYSVLLNQLEGIVAHHHHQIPLHHCRLLSRARVASTGCILLLRCCTSGCSLLAQGHLASFLGSGVRSLVAASKEVILVFLFWPRISTISLSPSSSFPVSSTDQAGVESRALSLSLSLSSSLSMMMRLCS